MRAIEPSLKFFSLMILRNFERNLTMKTGETYFCFVCLTGERFSFFFPGFDRLTMVRTTRCAFVSFARKLTLRLIFFSLSPIVGLNALIFFFVFGMKTIWKNGTESGGFAQTYIYLSMGLDQPQKSYGGVWEDAVGRAKTRGEGRRRRRMRRGNRHGPKNKFFFLPSVFICQYKLVINLRKHPLCTFPINIHPCVRGRFISSTARIPISRVHNFDLCPDKLKNIEK